MDATKTTRYAVEIDDMNRRLNPITRYLCRFKGRLFTTNAALETLIAGDNLATYSSRARAHAVYTRYALRNNSSASFRIFEVTR